MKRAVLVVTSLEDVTADLVIEELNDRGVRVARVDPADIGPELVFGAALGSEGWTGSLRTASRTVALEDVGAVYYRRPSPWSPPRDASTDKQIREFVAVEAKHGLGGVLTNLPGCRYVSHPAAVTRAEFKPAQLQTATRLGLVVPPTLITNDVERARRFAAETGPVVYKTFRGLPTGDDGRAGAIWAQRIDPETLDESLVVTAHLFQAEVPKTADARITVVGRRVFAQRISAPGRVLDWRRVDWETLEHEPLAVPPELAERLFAYLEVFGLEFGCFDFALREELPDGTPERFTFIECNANGQWGWLPDSTRIAGAFADLLREGCRP
ncbi:ATP-grasp ribosomal peptide maturase [Streptomyces katsurahamanus]|uniref:ATP-grasp ribosomal peptide maturase n=1 Tax=Streptomyces katsurahamanus TaxID=2577098 RepID=A0ABW9P2J1_9ACTN|nr:ATP-grasp ribosomal peptide maturase [Streptomyces katsurahamanus]MQS39807.1 ATP-grasp ribosomal peptide maturase [Streptomyces katsurahamanus]